MVVLCPFGVYPPRSGGHIAVLEPARHLARSGVSVHLFGLGIRRFEAFRHLRSFERDLEPGLVEERHVSAWNWVDFLRRGRTGLPPLEAGSFLCSRRSKRLAKRMAEADGVVCELPWLFSVAPDDRPRVFVAHNVESELVETNPRATPEQIELTRRQEGDAWQRADRVICFTREDRDELARRYGERPAEIIPLGVDIERVRPAEKEARDRARHGLGVGDRLVVLFTGAWHVPNRAARDRVLGWAEAFPDRFLFVVAGSVGRRARRGRNWVVTGALPHLTPWFQAADVCVNPVTEGSGANVKMLEYLAYGLPVVTTPFGARGLEDRTDPVASPWLVRDVHGFPSALTDLEGNAARRQQLAAAGRRWVESERSWSVLARMRRTVIEAAMNGPPETAEELRSIHSLVSAG